MGHLRRSCPKSLPSRPYPLSIDNSVHMYMCEVGSPDASGSGLYCEVNCDNAGLHDLSRGWNSLECDSVCNCLDLREHEYAWGPDDKSTEVMQVQGRLKRHVDRLLGAGFKGARLHHRFNPEWLCATAIFCPYAIYRLQP